MGVEVVEPPAADETASNGVPWALDQDPDLALVAAKTRHRLSLRVGNCSQPLLVQLGDASERFGDRSWTHRGRQTTQLSPKGAVHPALLWCMLAVVRAVVASPGEVGMEAAVSICSDSQSNYDPSADQLLSVCDERYFRKHLLKVLLASFALMAVPAETGRGESYVLWPALPGTSEDVVLRITQRQLEAEKTSALDPHGYKLLKEQFPANLRPLVDYLILTTSGSARASALGIAPGRASSVLDRFSGLLSNLTSIDKTAQVLAVTNSAARNTAAAARNISTRATDKLKLFRNVHLAAAAIAGAKENVIPQLVETIQAAVATLQAQYKDTDNAPVAHAVLVETFGGARGTGVLDTITNIAQQLAAQYGQSIHKLTVAKYLDKAGVKFVKVKNNHTDFNVHVATFRRKTGQDRPRIAPRDLQ
jgi:hypothetical protein